MFPCELAASVLCNKGIHWPKPEIKGDPSLIAQLIYQFGLALDYLWTRRFHQIALTVAERREQEELALFASRGWNDQFAALKVLRAAKEECRTCFGKFHTALRNARNIPRHFDYNTGKEIDPPRESIALAMAESNDCLAMLKYRAAADQYGNLMSPAISRARIALRKDFNQRFSNQQYDPILFFSITPEELNDECEFARKLGLEWTGKVCGAISGKIQARRRYSLPSYSLRRNAGNLEKYFQSYKDSSEKKDWNPFLSWVYEEGAFEGISSDDQFNRLCAACRRQDRSLDKKFLKLVGRRFSAYRKNHAADCDRLRLLLG